MTHGNHTTVEGNSPATPDGLLPVSQSSHILALRDSYNSVLIFHVCQGLCTLPQALPQPLGFGNDLGITGGTT